MRKSFFLILSFFISFIVATAQKNPVPFVSQPLVPAGVAPGGGQLNLTVNGASFVPGAVVDWDGMPLATNFLSGSKLSAVVPATDVATAGTGWVTVVNPGSVASNVVFFPVAQPEKGVTFAEAQGSPVVLGQNDQDVPMSMVGGDLNGDGKLDLAVGMQPPQGSGHVVVLLGSGDGIFTPVAATAPTGVTPGAMAVGDFNGDGKLDLAVANSSSDTVSILLGNGDGTFTPAAGSPISVGSRPSALAVGDFNADGNLDLAVANSGSNNVSVLLGNGDGTFKSAAGSPVAAGDGSFGLAIGDFNGDGKLDLAVTDLTSNPATVTILLGEGSGSFKPAPGSPVTLSSEPAPMELLAGDFNGDGKTDLAITSYQDINSTTLLGNGDGTFTLVADCCGNSAEGATSTSGLEGGDFSGNGKLDLLFGDVTHEAGFGLNYITTMAGKGDGTFTASDYSILVPNSIVGMAVGDFNGDGKLDVATVANALQNVDVLLQAPVAASPDFSIAATASSTSASVSPGGSAIYGLKVSSLNGFTGTVSVSCSGAPKDGSCEILDYRAALPEPSVFMSTFIWYILDLKVTTQAPAQSAGGLPLPPPDGWMDILWFWLLAGAGVLLMRQRRLARYRSSSRRRFAVFAALIFGLLMCASCGGGASAAGRNTTANQGTPAGTYTLTATATSGKITHSQTFTLTVQ